MLSKFGICYLKGTTLAVDGIVIEPNEPSNSDVGGDVYSQLNCKGFYEMVGLFVVDY